MKEINNLHKYTFLYNSYMLQSLSQIENDLFHLIKYSICKWLEFFFPPSNLHKLVTKY